MAELKPCPFCGSRDVGIGFERLQFGEKVRRFIICNKCGGRTRHFTNSHGATDAWNRRSESKEPKFIRELEFTRQFIHEHGLEFALAEAWNRRVNNE